MELTYTDCTNQSDCSNISSNLEPGDSVSKTFSVKNTGTLDTSFKIIFSKSSNSFVDNELVYTLYNNDTDEEVTSNAIPYGDKKDVYIYTESIKVGETKNYKLTINFKNIESGNNESNKGGTFNINLGISKNNNIWDFDYTGDEQKFQVPFDGKYKIELWGASGTKGNGYGGLGAYVSGIINLNKTSLYLYVGGQGKQASAKSSVLGGYNGGGSIILSVDYNGAAGGGATDIRTVNGSWNKFNSLKSRIIVAGGGAGTVEEKATRLNFQGGGLISGETYGNDNAYPIGAHPSKQTSGGIVYTKNYKELYPNAYTTDLTGKFGYADQSIICRSGAGGGYYGGGTICMFGKIDEKKFVDSASISNGGSSFISGHNGCVAITEDSTEDNIKQRTDSTGNTCTDGTTDITCSYHYSGYIFTDTKMIDGVGYNWTTERGEYVGQPQPDGSITTGHSGNGYARITYLGNN